MLLLLAHTALAADLDLELRGPSGAAQVLLADVALGSLPSVTLPATDEAPAYRFSLALDEIDGGYQLDVRVEAVEVLRGGRERFHLVAAPRVSFLVGEEAQVGQGARLPGGESVVMYRVVARVVE